MTKRSLFVRGVVVGSILGLVCLTGCPAPKDDRGNVGPSEPRSGSGAGGAESKPGRGPEASARVATAKAEDVEAAKKLLDGLGASGKYTLVPDGVMTASLFKTARHCPPNTSPCSEN